MVSPFSILNIMHKLNRTSTGIEHIYSVTCFIMLFVTCQLYPQFSTIETASQRLIYYGLASSYLVKHVGSCSENALGYHSKLYNYTPSEKVTVLMHDLNDYGNAGASTIPRNFVMVAIAPANFVYETAPANERINATMNHEYAHIVTLDNASGSDLFFRSLFFGKVAENSETPLTMLYSYLTAPRRASPRWYREGIAVYLETWMAGGLGRALGGYDEMMFRTIIKEDRPILDILKLESEGTQTDFQVGANAYLYGTRFMSYLSFMYGSEKLINWTSREPDSYAYFASQFQNVYGLDLNKAWGEWIAWEKNFQAENLQRISAYPVTQFRNIAENTLGSLSRPYYEPTLNKIFAAVNYPGQTAYIASIDIHSGELKKICDIKGPALYFVSSLAYNPQDKTIFYTTDNNDWRSLYSVDISTGKSKLLLNKERIGDLAFNHSDKSLWGIRHYNGISTLVRIPYPYKEWNQVYSFPYGRDINDLDISHNGKYLTGALAEINGTQLLISLQIDSLLSGKAVYDTLFNFENSLPANFIFSRDDKYLYGSSYYSGVSNIYRYDLEKKDMSILSNSLSGLFRPIEYSEDSLIAFNYTIRGFTPVIIENKPVENVAAIEFLGQKIVEKDTIVKQWIAPPPGSVNFDSLTIYTGEYNSLSNLGFASLYPIIEGYKDFPSYGLRFNISDPAGFHNLVITASYSPNNLLRQNERVHLGFKYAYFEWEASAALNNADFYDLFGPTKVSRKGYSLGLKYHKYLIYDSPEVMDYYLYTNYYGNLERLPDYQNVIASYDRLANFGADFTYKDMRSSLGSVDLEKGFKFALNINNNFVKNTFFPHIHTDLDYGFALPLNHSSLWLRSSIGYSYGDRAEPFANFYFGGFGNNYVDNLPEKRYREYFSFPGVELNSIGGTNYAKLNIEWNLPPVRFLNFGYSSFYLNYIRTSLFSGAMTTNIDSGPFRRSLTDFGIQLDFKFIMFFHLKMTFSAGYAVALERDQRMTNETMFSLKIF